MTSKTFIFKFFLRLVCFLLPILFVSTSISLAQAAKKSTVIELAENDKTKPASEEEEEEEDDC